MPGELKGSTHPCPIPDCPRLRKANHAMCIFHWRRVPKALQLPFWSGEVTKEIWAQVVEILKKKESAPHA
jgi:hypothetical protein